MFESVLILCRGGWWAGVNHDNKANSAELGNLKGISVRYVPLYPSPFGRLGEPAHSHGHITNLFVSSLMFVSQCLCGRRTSFCVGHKHFSVCETNIYTYIQDTPLYIDIDYWHHFGHFQLEIVQTNYIGPGGLCAPHMVVYASVAGHC